MFTPTERGVFFQSLDPYFFPNSRLFLAGDFNCYDGSLDKMGGFLLNLLELFGFGPWFQACIATLYRGSFMQVLVNDFLSDSIPLVRGVRQRDALSPMLYVL